MDQNHQEVVYNLVIENFVVYIQVSVVNEVQEIDIEVKNFI